MEDKAKTPATLPDGKWLLLPLTSCESSDERDETYFVRGLLRFAAQDAQVGLHLLLHDHDQAAPR